jgi:hypothetical protein
MIARLLSDFGVGFSGGKTLDTRRLLGGRNIAFFVPDAAKSTDQGGRQIIPAKEFVLKHGVRTVFGMGGAYVDRSCLEYAKSFDLKRARSLSNRSLAPHLEFVDLGGHGYAKARLTGNELRTEFVCIPRRLLVASAPTVVHSATGSCIAPGFGRQASGQSSHNRFSRATSDYRSNRDQQPAGGQQTSTRVALQPVPLQQWLVNWQIVPPGQVPSSASQVSMHCCKPWLVNWTQACPAAQVGKPVGGPLSTTMKVGAAPMGTVALAQHPLPPTDLKS